MTKSRKQELSVKADEERRKCRDWLLKFMRANQPKFLTKAELHEAAMRELKVSKNSFDFGWISAIEETRRYDWHEPLRHDFEAKPSLPIANSVTAEKGMARNPSLMLLPAKFGLTRDSPGVHGRFLLLALAGNILPPLLGNHCRE